MIVKITVISYSTLFFGLNILIDISPDGERSDVLQYISMQCIPVDYNAQYISVYILAFHYILLHFITSCCISFCFVAFLYILLHFITFCCIILYFVAFHHTLLHFIIFCCISLHFVGLHIILQRGVEGGQKLPYLRHRKP